MHLPTDILSFQKFKRFPNFLKCHFNVITKCFKRAWCLQFFPGERLTQMCACNSP